jgi:hypothetical protein
VIDCIHDCSHQAFDICPETYLLPREHASFLASFHGGGSTAGSRNVWITKPVAASRGRGIAVTNSLNDIEASMAEAPIIAQVPFIFGRFFWSWFLRIFHSFAVLNPTYCILHQRYFTLVSCHLDE